MSAEISSLKPYVAGPGFDEYFTSRDAFSYECARNLLEHVRQHSLAQTILDLRNAERDLLTCLLYTSPSPRDGLLSRMPSSA